VPDGARVKCRWRLSRSTTTSNCKVDKRQKQIEESIQRYLNALEAADRTQPAELEAKTTRLQDKSPAYASRCETWIGSSSNSGRSLMANSR